MLRNIAAKVTVAACCTLLSTPSIAELGVSEDRITLGMVNVQSGPASGLGKGMLAGARAVFDDVNAKGGIHGRQIELIVRDDGYEPNRAIEETLEVIEGDEVFSLFGYVGTPTANAVLPIVRDYEIPLVGLFTGAGTLRRPVTRQVFNVRASYDDEAEAMVAHFLKNGAKTVAVFYQDDGFGKAVLSGTVKALEKRGMAVHATGTFKRNTLAIKQGLASLLKARPDAIVMVGPYAPLAAFVKEARAADLKAQMATVSFVGTENLLNAVGEAGNGVVVTQVVPFPYHDEYSAVKQCRELIEKAGKGKLGYVNLEGCLTAKVMVAALEKTGRNLTRESLVQALESMKQVDIGGLTISFSSSNHQASDRVYLSQIRNGRIAEIK